MMMARRLTGAADSTPVTAHGAFRKWLAAFLLLFSLVALPGAAVAQSAPVITSLSGTGRTTTDPFSGYIYGANFTGASAVTVDGISATFTVESDGAIFFRPPPHPAGTVDVRVTGPGGTSATSAATKLTYVDGYATFTSMSPTSGPRTGGTVVTVTGTNFTPGFTKIYFGPAGVITPTITSSTSLTFAVPSCLSCGTSTFVYLMTDYGDYATYVGAGTFTLVPAPAVTGLSAASGPPAGGNSVVISGTDFLGASSVNFGANAATFTVNSATQITATAPPGTGTVNVTVTNGGVTSAATSANSYSYAAAPAITGLTPSNGPSSGGTSVTIAGTDLGGATAVSFGANAAAFTVNSASQITATAPAGTGVVDVKVTTAGGTSATSAADQFTYVDAPVASDFVAGTVAFNGGSGLATNIDLSSHVTNSPTSYAVGSAITAQGGTVSVNASGTASYTPAAGFSGGDSFTFTAANAGGSSAPATVTLTVAAPSLSLSPSTLPNGTVDAAYSQALTASGGIAPYTYAITAGVLPTGLTLTPSGALQGTPSAAGNYSLTIQATDSSGAPGPYVAAKSYDISIAAATQSISFANPGPQAYGTTPTLTATATSGLAVTFTSSTTAVCTVTAGGQLTFPGIGTCTINADQSGNTNYTAAPTVSRSFAVATPALAATVAQASVNGTVGQPLAATPIMAGGGEAPYSYALTGTLPAGLTFSSSAGTLSGTPTAGMAATAFTVTVTDALNQTASGNFTLSIGAPTITLAPSTLPAGVVNVNYSGTIAASGGTAPYTYAVTAGSLPTGLTLAPNGTLSGTLTASGTFNFTVTSTDSSTGSGPFTGSRGYTLTVNLPPVPTIAPVPTQVTPGNTSSNIQSLDIPLNTYVSGQYSALAIAASPSHGTVSLIVGAPGSNGVLTYTARYTPTVGYSGSDSFSFTATGPGGTSAPASVSISVEGVQPSAVAHSASATQSTPVMIDLTAGASGGPFTGATVVSVSPAGSVATSISAGAGGTYVLTATPSATFEGTATIQYTLSNAFGASAPSTVTLTVAPRPIPSLDPTVAAVVSAQAETARRFAAAQLTNFQRRNEQLHHGGGAGASSALSLIGGDGEKLRRARLAFNVPGWTDPAETLRAPVLADVSATPDTVSLAPPAPGLGNRPVGSAAVWTGGALMIGSVDGSRERGALDFSTAGLSFGVDVRLTETFTLGIGGGYGHDTTDIGKNDGEVRSGSRSVSAYASWMAGPTLFVDTVVGAGRIDNRTRRLAPNGETAGGERAGDMAFASLSTGYDGVHGETGLSVFAKLDWLRARLDRYTETGAGIYNLAFDRLHLTSLGAGVGGRISWQLAGWTPRLRAEWRHEFKGLSAQELDYADAGTFRYALGSSRWARDTVSGEAGADFLLGDGWTASLDLGGGFGDGTRYGTGRFALGFLF